MKKKLIVLFFITCLFSCKTFTLISNQQIERNYGITDFELISNQMIVRPIINNKTYSFLFDTGAGFVVNDSLIFKDVDKDKITDFGFVKLPDGSFSKKKNIVLPFKLGYAESENTLFTQLPKYKFLCKNKYVETSGIFGLNYINSVNLNDTFVCLNFTKSRIENFSEIDLNQKLIGFNEIKSKFHLSGVYIFLMIAGKEEKMFFDTGNAGSIILNEESQKFTSKKTFETLGNNYFSFKSKINGQNKLYINEPIKIGDFEYEANVNQTKSISKNNLGIKFIKAFDWVFDFKNEKIYFRKNENEIENTFTKFDYAAMSNDSKLLILLKEKSQTKYNLGDEIVSVNYQKVNANNICELQDLLNKTIDWNTLNLEVISNKN